MTLRSFPRGCRIGLATLALTLVGCGSLLSTATSQPSFYALAGFPAESPAAPWPTGRSNTGPTLMVAPPHAASGFDSPRIIYVREAYKLEYFAHSEWVDTPARMVALLIVAAVERSGAFRAVAPMPHGAVGELRLDTEIIRLQHDVGSQPSRVRFTLRAYLVDNRTRRVLDWREFDTSVVAASDDPQGGVVAANHAVQAALQQLAGFCAEGAAAWQGLPREAPTQSGPARQTTPGAGAGGFHSQGAP